MNENGNLKPTPFDVSTQSPSLQMLKTLLPFFSYEMRFPLCMLIKIMELQNTIRLFQRKEAIITQPKKEVTSSEIFSMILESSPSEQQNEIRSMLEMLKTMELFEAFQGFHPDKDSTSENSDSDYASVLTKEQYEKFKSYETEFD